MNEVIREFLIETNENLAQLDLDLITLEKDPHERETLARVFRTLHTIKGTAGFLGLAKLQAVSHAAENLLSLLRDEKLTFNAEIASALLSVVDAVRTMLDAVEASETDGDGDFSQLIELLAKLLSAADGTRTPVAPSFSLQGMASLVTPPASPEPSLVFETAPAGATMVATNSLVQEASESRAPAVSDTSIRVDVGLLDQLMNLVGELVLARNQLIQFTANQENLPFHGTAQRLNHLTAELQAGVMKTRMQPIGTLWSKFPRVVRDLALACGKQARIEMDGQETELDKTIIEAMRDPLTHLVRNAVDHGIESPAERAAKGKPPEGRLALRAFHEGGKVIIEITDDGAGINPQRVRAKAIERRLVTPEQADRLSDRDLVNLIFLPGFSTTDEVTQFSGRGVGMDVVRTNIERIGGSVTIDSRPGRGATVRMKIPLTLAIIPALTVSSGGERYAIPQVSLLELVRLEGNQSGRNIEHIHGAPVFRLRGNLLPVVSLGDVLGDGQTVDQLTESESESLATYLVVLQADDRQFGLLVDAIHDTEEIVVKPLQKRLKNLSVYAGATIMGDGRVALILDVLGVAQSANVISGVRERVLSEEPTESAESVADRQPVLLVAADGGQMAIPLSQVARLEEFPRTAVEMVGPQEVVQYRDEILPLLRVSQVLRGERSVKRRAGKAVPMADGDTIAVVVVSDAGRRVGLVVDRILDVVEEPIVSRSPAHRPGALFTAVVQERVTEFLDLGGILGSVDPDLVEPPQFVMSEA